MANELELQQFEAGSFMGISNENPILIDFTGKRKGNILELSGNQGVGKTSTLLGILYAMGAAFDIDKKKLLNTNDGAIDINLKFKYGGEQYHVVGKTNRIELKKFSDGKWRQEDSPVAMLRKIFGPVGLSPFGVKNMKGKDQIQYFQDMFGSGEDASKKMKKLEADIENVFQARRDVNREIKALKGALEMDVLYQNYEKSQNRFKAAPNPKKEKERMDAISEKKAAFDKAKTTLSSLEAQLESSDESIKELEERLDAERKNNAALRQRVDTGKKYIKENSGVEKEYEVANDSWLNISKEMAEYEKWKSVIAKEKELFEREDAAQGATGQLDSLRDQLLKLTKQCLPKVDGLTIKVAAGLDKEGQQEGIFYTEQPIHELSESEYTAMWCKIWDAAGVSHVFIENISSLGTDAVNVLNTIAKNGGMVFATKMDRKTDDISIAFVSEIK